MPTVTGTDNFSHGNFAVPGGGSYIEVVGTPTFVGTDKKEGTPGSLLLDPTAAAEYLGKNTPSAGARGWQGIFWRLTTEPGSTADVVYFWTSGFAGAAGLRYNTTGDSLYLFMSGSTDLQVVTGIVANQWYWIEMIWDVSTTSYVLYARLNGVDLASLAGTGAATTVVPIYLGTGGAVTTQQRFADWRYGTAASGTDWLGQPNTGDVAWMGA